MQQLKCGRRFHFKLAGLYFTTTQPTETQIQKGGDQFSVENVELETARKEIGNNEPNLWGGCHFLLVSVDFMFHVLQLDVSSK
jgi:hypothetical protein